jgi:hypothetical protein
LYIGELVRFTIYFGDILNIDKNDNKYYLLQTYLEVSYSYNSVNCKLHRGIINEFETTRDRYNIFKYSGFVHYNGINFCYGGSRADDSLNTIRLEGLTEDRFIVMYETFLNYFSHSSHESIGGAWKKLDAEKKQNISYEIVEYMTVDNYKLPFKIKQTTVENSNIPDYSKPYLEVLTEATEKYFYFNNKKIIPKIVKHESKESSITTEKNLWVNISQILDDVKKLKTTNKINEITNKPRISFSTYFLKSTVAQQRMDGNFYI